MERYKIKYKDYLKKNNTLLYKLFLCIVISIVFLAVRPIATYDGFWYLSYLDYLDGTLPFNEWNAIRGFVYPLILYIGYLLFPEGGYGINFVFLLFYLLMFIYVLKTIEFYRKELLKSTKWIYVDYSLATLFIAFNPIIWVFRQTHLLQQY